MTHDATRRDFLALAGSGLFVLFRAEPCGAFQAANRLPPASYPEDFNAYLRIGSDGRVTCFTGKVEYGQGVMTSFAQMLADELDVAFDSVDVVMGDTEQCPQDIGTFGSLSTRQFGPALRAAAAEARAVLLELAAERLQTAVDRLKVRDGIVSDSADPSRQVSYAELVQGRRIERHIPSTHPKAPGEFAVMGHPARRKDALDKVTGQAKYAGDVVRPGMLYACILRPPAHGAVLREADTGAVAEIEGARLVREGDFVAVLHPRPDIARKALEQVKATFHPVSSQPDDRTIFDHLLRTAPTSQLVAEAGDVAKGEQAAAAILEATYFNSYVAHASIETHAALASVENGKVAVWASTQTPFPLQRQLAQALGIAAKNVRVITPYVGGGFGGKSASQQAIDAARLSQITGRPVQVMLSRAEEFFEDTFRPAAVVRIKAGMTAAGKLCSWRYQVFGAGDREAQAFYDIPNHHTESAGGWQGGNPPGMHPFAVGPWRAPSVNTNTFARESHIDMLAANARIDPLEFRLRNVSDPRMRRVLEAAAKQFGWSAHAGATGMGIGVACGIYSGTYVATMARTAVDKDTGKVRVERVVTAMDAGLLINPDGVRQQIEGSIMMGLGYALTEEVRFRGGDVLHRSFAQYPIPRFAWLPKIETVLIENPELPAQGCGEPPIITMGAVIANAIYDATGARITRLPMTPDRLRGATG